MFWGVLHMNKHQGAPRSSALADPNRLSALARSALMDSDAEEVFDRAVRLAKQITGRPVALLTLVDDRRQFFKAHLGLPDSTAEARQTPLSHSLCQHVVAEGAPLEVSNAQHDLRVKDNGAVEDLGVKAYYGVPVHDGAGLVLGSLCAIDTIPHEWSDDERESLRDIADMIETELQLRQSVEDRNMLMGELSHRIKNIFTVTASLVRMTARSADSVDDMAETLSTRLAALDAAQTLAMTPSEGTGEGVNLTELFHKVLQPYKQSQITLTDEEIVVGPKAATAFALIFHELATNATKYGAFSDPGGALAVAWHKGPEMLEMSWREILPETTTMVEHEPLKDGFGSQLIDINLQHELSGQMTREFLDTGMAIDMRIPLAALTAD